jgi:hypothetical protein
MSKRGGILGLGMSLTRSEADGAYVPRYNPSGAAAGLVLSSRFIESAASVIGDDAPGTFSVRRFNGTPQAPTAVLSGEVAGLLTTIAWNGTAWVTTSQIRTGQLENVTATAHGAELVFRTVELGGTNLRSVVAMRAALGTGDIIGAQTVLRVVPTTAGTGALRTPLNTASVVDWGQDTLGFYNVARVARQLVPLGSTTDTVINALNALGLIRLA